MGNHWGVIHNQTLQDINYILHYEKLTPTEAKIIFEAGLDLKVVMVDPQVGIKGSYKIEITELAKKVNCVYTLPSTRFTKTGLQDVDFQSIHFITISTKGKILLDSGQISKDEHIRLKIGPDGNIKQMSQQEAEDIKKFADGKTGEKGLCPVCEDGSKIFNKNYKDEMKCLYKKCDEKSNDLWTCGNIPHKHLFCDECYQQLLVNNDYIEHQKKLKEEKEKKEKQKK